MSAEAPKLSRYRTLRGRNVPESRREPDQNHGAGPTSGSNKPPSRQMTGPPLVPLPSARNARNTVDASALLEEQKRKDLERLQLQLETHQSSSRPPKTTTREKFSFFIRRRTRQNAPALDTTTPVEPRATHQDHAPASTVPDSAVGRTVLVRCRQFSAEVAIQPETTAADLLDSCVRFSSWNVRPEACILAESCVRLGLERRLRRYERIRDVLNSWDHDADNALVILPAAANGTATDLEVTAVSRNRSTPPSGLSFVHMYYSQKPGRWNKCFVSLLESTGQLVTSKKADPARLASFAAGEGGSGRDYQALCRLSDYDIYRPTEAQMRKVLKPPKKLCFAVKSQQRTTVFINTDNYVHFFCVDSPQGHLFYDRIFAWRSWYLVNRLLALPSGPSPPANHHSVRRPATEERASHKTLDRYQEPRSQTLTSDTTRDGPFTSGSLLDSSHVSRPPPTSSNSNRAEPSSWLPPAVDHSNRPARTLTVSSRPSSSRQPIDREASISRHRSVHQSAPSTPQQQPRHPPLPVPLVDLTPSFKEPPQWSRENRGHGVRAPPGTTHLVDLARSTQKGDELSTAFETPLRRDDALAARAHTMTSASASAAASFSRSHQSIHRSASQRRANPPVPLLSRIPSSPVYDGTHRPRS